MKLSHSKLNTILTCPASYYLNYKVGISLKEKPAALSIGTAVHWGIEHNAFDLEEFYENEGKGESRENEYLAKAMIKGYLFHKDKLFEKIMWCEEEQRELEILDEYHELTIYTKLKSYKFNEEHNFMGIIDLLFLTEKGFILIDYKTSSFTPDFDEYLDQIYRYIYLLNNEFPEVPVYKIGIINLQKARLKQSKNETYDEFVERLEREYQMDEKYINYHEFDASKLDKNNIEEYVKNLSLEADAAESIDRGGVFYINYGNAKGAYGKSQYWDIFYKVPEAYKKYKITDHILDVEERVDENGNIIKEETIKKERGCVYIDMLVLENNIKPLLNKYQTFKKEAVEYFEGGDGSFDGLNEKLKSKYITDAGLLEKYTNTFIYEINNKTL